MVHLPAVNTPQFDWCKTSLSRHPQPVPPIYQPERAAQAIVAAALGRRPVRVLGSWNRMLVFLGRLFPNLANRYAALGAWETQLTDEPVSPERPANLFHPVDEGSDRGAHGSFDDEAGGFTDPSFLRSLPVTMLTFFRAVAATGAEKAGYATALPEALRPRNVAAGPRSRAMRSVV